MALLALANHVVKFDFQTLLAFDHAFLVTYLVRLPQADDLRSNAGPRLWSTGPFLAPDQAKQNCGSS